MAVAVPPLTTLSESKSAPVNTASNNNNRNGSRIGAYRIAPGGVRGGGTEAGTGSGGAPVFVPELAPTTLTANTSSPSQDGFIPMTALTESTSAPQTMMATYYERLRMEKLQQQQIPAPSRFPQPPPATANNTRLYRGHSNESDNTSGNRQQQQQPVGEEHEQRIQRRYRRRVNQELETATKKLRSHSSDNNHGGGGRGSDVGLQNPQIQPYHHHQQEQQQQDGTDVTIAVDYGDGTEYALNFPPHAAGTSSGGDNHNDNNTNRVMNSSAGAGGTIPEERRSRRFFGVPSTYPDFDGDKDAGSRRRTLLRNFCILGISLVLIAVTVVLVLKFAVNKDDDGDRKGGTTVDVDGSGSGENTDVFGDEFEDRRRSSLFIIRNVITSEHYDAIVNHVNKNGIIDDNSSEGVDQLPQYLAWEWIVKNDNMSPISESSTSQIEVFATRYTLVLFYYYMNGPNWTVQPNWLDAGGDLDTCSWTYVSCSNPTTTVDEENNVDDGRVQVLNITENNLSGSIPMELHQLSHLGKRKRLLRTFHINSFSDRFTFVHSPLPFYTSCLWRH